MTNLAPVRDQLARLIPRLASDHDGEVVATARAIQRTLETKRLDFHDLAQAVAAEPPPPRIVYVERPSRAPETWAEIAQWCVDNDGDRLKPHESDFVSDMADALICDGEPTERQGRWLRALYARLKRGGGA